MGRVIGEQVSCSLAWLSNESKAREQDGSTAVARPMYLILAMYGYIPIGILHWSMLCAYARNPVTHNHVVVAFVICIVLYCIVMYVLYNFVFLIIKKKKKKKKKKKPLMSDPIPLGRTLPFKATANHLAPFDRICIRIEIGPR